jgi:hypothetical protein
MLLRGTSHARMQAPALHGMLHGAVRHSMPKLPRLLEHHHHHVTNQAIASMPSTPRPTGAEGRGSTAPECLQVLRTSQACTRYLAICIDWSITSQLRPATCIRTIHLGSRVPGDCTAAYVAGHAPNALPQKSSAACREFLSVTYIRAPLPTLRATDPEMQIQKCRSRIPHWQMHNLAGMQTELAQSIALHRTRHLHGS